MTKRHVLLKVVHLVVESAGLPLSRPVVIHGIEQVEWRDHATCPAQGCVMYNTAGAVAVACPGGRARSSEP